jgi:hypothetical protein
VLGASGHIAGVVNPPRKTAAISGLATTLPATPTTGLRTRRTQRQLVAALGRMACATRRRDEASAERTRKRGIPRRSILRRGATFAKPRFEATRA